jgi:hypothetical protein
VPQGHAAVIEQQDRAAATGNEVLERNGDPGEDLRQRGSEGDELEDLGLPVQQRDAVGVVEPEPRVDAGHAGLPESDRARRTVERQQFRFQPVAPRAQS